MTEKQEIRCIRHLLRRAQEMTATTFGLAGDYKIGVKESRTCPLYYFRTRVNAQSYVDYVHEFHTRGATRWPIIFGIEFQVDVEVGYGDNDDEFARRVLNLFSCHIRNNIEGTAAVYMLLFLGKQRGLTSDLLRCLYSFLVHV
jgi:hypothetical protein